MGTFNFHHESMIDRNMRDPLDVAEWMMNRNVRCDPLRAESREGELPVFPWKLAKLATRVLHKTRRFQLATT